MAEKKYISNIKQKITENPETYEQYDIRIHSTTENNTQAFVQASNIYDEGDTLLATEVVASAEMHNEHECSAELHIGVDGESYAQFKFDTDNTVNVPKEGIASLKHPIADSFVSMNHDQPIDTEWELGSGIKVPINDTESYHYDNLECILDEPQEMTENGKTFYGVEISDSADKDLLYIADYYTSIPPNYALLIASDYDSGKIYYVYVNSFSIPEYSSENYVQVGPLQVRSNISASWEEVYVTNTCNHPIKFSIYTESAITHKSISYNSFDKKFYLDSLHEGEICRPREEILTDKKIIVSDKNPPETLESGTIYIVY